MPDADATGLGREQQPNHNGPVAVISLRCGDVNRWPTQSSRAECRAPGMSSGAFPRIGLPACRANRNPHALTTSTCREVKAMALSEFPRLNFDPFVELRRMQSEINRLFRV